MDSRASFKAKRMMGLSACFMALCTLLAAGAYAYVPNCEMFKNDDQNPYRFRDNDYDDRYGLRTKHKVPADCSSASENVRGSYTSKLKPCIFSFHKIPNDDSGNKFRLPVVCSDENQLNEDTIKEYVKKWPDECVGDFPRCYKVQRDEKVFLQHLCKKGWPVPEGMTHLSVDCTTDKVAKLQANSNQTAREPWETNLEKQIKREDEKLKELEIAMGVSYILILLGCFLCVMFSYRWLFRPYYQIVSQKGD